MIMKRASPLHNHGEGSLVHDLIFGGYQHVVVRVVSGQLLLLVVDRYDSNKAFSASVVCGVGLVYGREVGDFVHGREVGDDVYTSEIGRK